MPASASALRRAPRNQVVCSGGRNVEPLPHDADRDKGGSEQFVHDAVAVAGRAAQVVCDPSTVLLAHSEDCARRLRGFLADVSHAAKEEREPAFPVAFVADGLKSLVVFGAVPLEVVGDIEDRFAWSA